MRVIFVHFSSRRLVESLDRVYFFATLMGWLGARIYTERESANIEKRRETRPDATAQFASNGHNSVAAA